MPSEDQLKATMKAAIAKKKEADVPEDTKSTSSSKSTSKSDVASSTKTKTTPKPKFSTPHPAIYQSRTAITQSTSSQESDSSVANEAELIRNFFGRPVRIGVYQRQVYFCVPDVLEISNKPDGQLKYSEFKKNSDAKKIINPLVIIMWFFNLSSGANDKLDAASANNLIEIITKLKLPFPEPIEKWLTDTSDKIEATLAQ